MHPRAASRERTCCTKAASSSRRCPSRGLRPATRATCATSPGPSKSSGSFVYPAARAKLRTSLTVQDEGLSAIWRKELRQSAEAQHRRPHSTQLPGAATALRQTAHAFEHEAQYAGSDLCRSSTARLHFSDPQQPLPHRAHRSPFESNKTVALSRICRWAHRQSNFGHLRSAS